MSLEPHQVSDPRAKEIATIGGGCFWCTEAVFKELRGVEKVESGYSGGKVEHPSYQEVCTGATGHAEVVRVTFDPRVISYRDILQIFFTTHDPTTLNRQGADVGTQYRSVVFYHDNEQKAAAEQAIREFNASKVWKRPIVTEVIPFKAFYKAEEYHQNYFERNPNSGYCQAVIEPKIAKLRAHYYEKLRNPSLSVSPKTVGRK
jgi:peptide-methionine (S)-S-oxide reductase